MFAKFVIEEGDLKGLTLSLEEGDSWTIGRDGDECEIVIEDPMVSRKHLIARRTADGGISVENLSETNPALLNDEALDDQPRLLQNGDTLKLGNEVIRYYEDASLPIIDKEEPLNVEGVEEETADEEDLREEAIEEKSEEEGKSEEERPSEETLSAEPLAEEIPEYDEIVSEQAIGEEGSGELAIEEKPEENEKIKEPSEKKSAEEFHFENIEALLEQKGEEITTEAAASAKELIEPVEGFEEAGNGEGAQQTASHPPESPPALEPEPEAKPELSQAPPLPDTAAAQDTLFAEEGEDLGALAEIDFGVIETGRWLLKVIGGPNNGAEFHMESGNSYVLGTDPRSCDIVFHDNSVSRQHARITVTAEDTLLIEDLKSRNGVMVNGEGIQEKMELPQGAIVTLGTTSFAVYDREGEMQTIISPLLPSIVKVLQQEPEKELIKEEAAQILPQAEAAPVEGAEIGVQKTAAAPSPAKPERHFGPYVVLTAIIGLFVLAGIGTTTLFREEPVATQYQENADELIGDVLKPFPAVRWNFNKSTGALFLLGHVATTAEKNQLIHQLKNLKFIKNLDDNGIIIDEGVLNEVNSLLSSNAAWKEITIHSPAAGQFILSGELQTRKQAEQLSSYLNLNFPYLDLLKKQIVVEEDVVNQVNAWLQDAQIFDVLVKMDNGEVTLSGSVSPDKQEQFNEVIAKVKQIPGVRILSNLVRQQTIDTGIINITDRYPVMGKSRIGDKFTVVINGRILSENDELDGMTITKITANRVSLERDGDKFRIDY